MELIDIGANLGSNQFRSDLQDVLARARAKGVGRMVITGTSLEGSERALQLSEEDSDLWCTAGVHPHDAKDWTDATEAGLRGLLGQSRTVAVGECGLDFNRNYSPPETQRTAFKAQLELAIATGLPLFLHQRDAHGEFLGTLRDAWPDLGGGAVVHCFTDGPEEAADYLELGCHLGVTGWVTDARRGDALRRAVPTIPDDRLMLETDAPYLMPQSIRPKPKTRRNEPMHLPHVARAVADLRGQSVEEVAALSTATAERFFRLDGEAPSASADD